MELCEQYSPENQDGLKILMTHLMKRTVVGVSRLMKLRDEKAPLTALVKQGAVGEELLERMTQAEKEMEAELTEVREIKWWWGETVGETLLTFLKKRLVKTLISINKAGKHLFSKKLVKSSCCRPKWRQKGLQRKNKR